MLTADLSRLLGFGVSPEAASADIQASHLAIHHEGGLVGIGLPAAVRPSLGVAYIVTILRATVTNVTSTGHEGLLSYILMGNMSYLRGNPG